MNKKLSQNELTKQLIKDNNPLFVLQHKIDIFKNKKGTILPIQDFNYQEVVQKFGPNPICYLSGRQIDYTNKYSYQLDHIIPSAKKGSNELDNLGLIKPWVNVSKSFHSVEDFLLICKEVLEHNGYKVTKIN